MLSIAAIALCMKLSLSVILSPYLQTLKRGEHIYTRGCIISFEDWIKTNLYTVGGILIGLAIFQVCPVVLIYKLQLTLWWQQSIFVAHLSREPLSGLSPAVWVLALSCQAGWLVSDTKLNLKQFFLLCFECTTKFGRLH